jgi:hypothetical protein
MCQHVMHLGFREITMIFFSMEMRRSEDCPTAIQRGGIAVRVNKREFWVKMRAREGPEFQDGGMMR